MSTTERNRSRLINLLKELFQLDRPDLDFGFYRIMLAKSQQVTSFIDKDLLKTIENAFGQVDENRKAELQANIQKEIEAAKEYGVADPENSPKVLAAKAKYDALKDGAAAEADVYNHLYRFFERYYDEGDFISRRYYARENAGKAAPFAIPYNGEEVKLHWANADQYYIKTADYFTNFTFDLAKSKEVLDNQKSAAPLELSNNLRVHFRIVEASEGEHGNVKAAEDKKRFFILHEENPVELNEANELVINFEYKSLPGGKNEVDSATEQALKAKFGKNLNKGDMPNLAIAEKVIKAISELENAKDYIVALSLLAPTDKIENRPLLAKYINQYTARNTCDYFIHKDLSGFLRRELDFYIKNEVMHLDDIENADVPAVENYLEKLKVIRKIATQLIDFLAQLENFQKKLWLKKKFITETNYCITLDRVPEALYEEIAANDAQREEWVTLFAIDKIKVDGSPAYSVPLTTDFLKANDKLVLDTAFFSSDFKARLIASIEDFDEQCDGLLIHSENFQALNLLQARYRNKINTVYIDPPYNTEKDRAKGKFLYKDDFAFSSWNTMMENRIQLDKILLSSEAAHFVSIDDSELSDLIIIIKNNYCFQGVFTWRRTRTGGHLSTSFNQLSDYVVVSTNTTGLARLFGGTADAEESQPLLKNENSPKELSFLPGELYFKDLTSGLIKKGNYGSHGQVSLLSDIEVLNNKNKNVVLINGPFIWTQENLELEIAKGAQIIIKKHENLNPRFLREPDGHKPMPSLGDGDFTVGTNEDGSSAIENLFGSSKISSYPKPVKLIERMAKAKTHFEQSGFVLDYFAGSGTTGHAVINLNREDQGNRKYILVEMGDYFDTVTKPRIAKVIYSSDWKNGKPTNRDTGVSQCFKYIRLETYEDTLNNLVFDENPVRNRAIESHPLLKEDYMLRYLLDVETRGSQSLLNIDAFADPTSYSLVVKRSGSDEQVIQNIDLIETFNYLLGLRLEHMDAPQTFTASFTRKPDPELPEDQQTKLIVDGKIQLAADGKWWFRKLEGWVPADPMNPNNGQKEKVLIVWRKLTGNLEEDNLMLDEWFRKYRISSRESAEFDVIYVNGSNNLPNLKKDEERWKVRLIEEDFHKLMWAVEGEA